MGRISVDMRLPTAESNGNPVVVESNGHAGDVKGVLCGIPTYGERISAYGS